MISFCCGCTSKIRLPVEDPKQLATFDAVAFDPEGFMICAIHRERRRGWRSVPYTATTAPFYGMGMWTELQWDQYLVFNKVPESAKKNEMRAT